MDIVRCHLQAQYVGSRPVDMHVTATCSSLLHRAEQFLLIGLVPHCLRWFNHVVCLNHGHDRLHYKQTTSSYVHVHMYIQIIGDVSNKLEHAIQVYL